MHESPEEVAHESNKSWHDRLVDQKASLTLRLELIDKLLMLVTNSPEVQDYIATIERLQKQD